MANYFLCFIHIERCGGTTFHRILKRNFPFSYFSFSPHKGREGESGFELYSDSLKILTKYYPMISGIGGHTTRVYLNYNRVIKKTIFYFTFLRDPVKRYLSHIAYYIVRNNFHQKNYIEEFIADKRFNNLQTRRIAGCPDLKKAKDYLTNEIKFIGITERFDESLLILNRMLNYGLSIHYKRENTLVSSQKLQYQNLPERIQTSIIKNNRLDLELYEFGKELFIKQINQYGDSLINDLDRYRNEQKLFEENSFDKIKISSAKVLKRFILEPMMFSNCSKR